MYFCELLFYFFYKSVEYTSEILNVDNRNKRQNVTSVTFRYLFQEVLDFPLPALPGCHQLQVSLLGKLCQGHLFLCLMFSCELFPKTLQLSPERKQRNSG